MKLTYTQKVFGIILLINLFYFLQISAMNYVATNILHIDIPPQTLIITLGIIVGIFIFSLLLGVWVTKRLTAPMKRIRNVMRKISEGDLEARVGIQSGDEFEEISNTIDQVLNERVGSVIQVEEENEQLNDSVVELLETVAQLAQKNLSIRAKVSKDITGPLADALNMMTTETSKVLNEVFRISVDVAETSNMVKSHADNVLLLANNEQNEVNKAEIELKQAADAMLSIAELAQTSNEAAADAIETTITAMGSVTDTVDSINNIRDSIRDTEKKIKRLGERSQEISTAVNLINNISEKTQILALNASMHAAAAGDAGKGFVVIADEVQRLAENAREATSQIALLVQNIQSETTNTVTTMDDLITQVVHGSQLAENAGDQMKETQFTTAKLVNMVEEISQNAVAQTATSKVLRSRTDNIRESVLKTGRHLKEQSQYTDELVAQAMSLVRSVSVFKLVDDDPS